MADCGGTVEILIPAGCDGADVIDSTTITVSTVIADGGAPIQVFFSNPTVPSLLIFPTPGAGNEDRLYIVQHIKASVLMTLVVPGVGNLPMSELNHTVGIFSDGSVFRVLQNLTDDLLDSWRVKGYLDGSEEPDYPAASAGHAYRVMQPGRIGGSDGALVDLDDVLIARVDGAIAGDFDSASGNWAIVPKKVTRAIGSYGLTINGNLVTSYGTDEQTVADSGLSVEVLARNTGETFTGDVNVTGTQGYASFQVGVLRAVWARFTATVDAPSFQFVKGRGTPAVPAVIAQGDELGAVFNFRGISNVNGSDRLGAWIMPVCVDPTPSDTSMGGELRLGTTAIGSTTPTDRIIISQAGHVRQPSDQVRNSAQFDKTNTTFNNVTGLAVALEAGKTYHIRAVLDVDTPALGGHKYAIAGTATATSLLVQVNTFNTITPFLATTLGRITAMAGSVGVTEDFDGQVIIEGHITVNAAGTLTVQFAQNAASGTSSVLINSFLEVVELT